MKEQQIRIIVIVICLVILMSGGTSSLFLFSSIGYTSGYEGVKASFAGIEWQTVGTKAGSGKHDLMGTDFYFDADEPQYHAPNLVGEMTNAFLPEQSVKPAFVFPDMWGKNQYIKNPYDTDEWNLPNPDEPNETIAYVMEEWILKLYISVTAEWDSSTTVWTKDKEEYGDTRYQNTKIWLKLDISPMWYFEGADQVYFGLGKVVCSDVTAGKFGETDEDYEPTGKYSVVPASTTTYRYLYHTKYGTAQFTPTNPKTYRGRRLNPEIFGDEIYFNVNLANFGTHAYRDVLQAKHAKGDAVTWGFDVHVFVVGEWRVQDIEEIPTDYGREPMVEHGFTYYLAEMLNDPRLWFWGLLALGAVIFLFLAIFAPTALFAIFGLFGMFKRDKKG